MVPARPPRRGRLAEYYNTPKGYFFLAAGFVAK